MKYILINIYTYIKNKKKFLKISIFLLYWPKKLVDRS